MKEDYRIIIKQLAVKGGDIVTHAGHKCFIIDDDNLAFPPLPHIVTEEWCLERGEDSNAMKTFRAVIQAKNYRPMKVKDLKAVWDAIEFNPDKDDGPDQPPEEDQGKEGEE